MANKTKIFNSAKFTSNPWSPIEKWFHKPTKKASVSSEVKDRITINMCRLSLLFPTIKTNYILKILKLHDFNITNAIDTLLLMRAIQKQTQRERNYNPYISQHRKLTCARCVPFTKKSLLTQMKEEEIVKEHRAILPNITYGIDNITALYEHELYFGLPSAQIRNNELNVARIQSLEERNTNEIIEVVDPDDSFNLSRFNKRPIKLKVVRKQTGDYSSQLMY